MYGRILKALVIAAAVMLLPAAAASADLTLSSSQTGIACAISGDCVATGQIAGFGPYDLAFHDLSWGTAVSPASPSPSAPVCSPVACIIPPVVWGGSWTSESGGTYTTIASPKLPSDADSNDVVQDLVGSCTWPNDCTFAANYEQRGGSAFNTVFLSFVNGKWGTDAEPKTPPAPNTGAEHDVLISGISCSQPGDCSAAGYYEYSKYRWRNLLLTESNGVWGHDVTDDLPASQADPTVPAQVACASAPYCIASSAAGVFTEIPTTKDLYGVWTAKKVPSSLNPDAETCALTGNCVIVGGSGAQGTILEQSEGAWKSMITLKDAGGPFTQVTCPSIGNCLAAGTDTIETETKGVWSTSPMQITPTGANLSTPDVQIDGVSCQSTGNCFVLGTYENVNSQTSDFLLTETSGVWSQSAAAFPS